MSGQLELGLDTFGDVTVTADGAAVPQPQVIRNVVEQAVLADQVGVDFFGIGEHHRADFAVTSPDVVLSAIAGRTQNIHLGSAVTVLSSDDPVRVFQRFATLDAVSNGRAEVILGRGSFTESFPLFGYELSDYDKLFEEKVELFAALRDEQPVTWSGTTRSGLDEQSVFPRTESGALKTWLGVGGSPESVVRAAHYGFGLLLAIIGGEPARFAPYSDLFHRAQDQFGTPPAPIGVHSPGHVADTDRASQGRALAALPRHDDPHRSRTRMAGPDPGPLRGRRSRGLHLCRVAGDGGQEDRRTPSRFSAPTASI